MMRISIKLTVAGPFGSDIGQLADVTCRRARDRSPHATDVVSNRGRDHVCRHLDDEQVYMWECLLSSSAAVTAIGTLGWVSSPDGYRLVGTYLPAQDPSETGP